MSYSEPLKAVGGGVIYNYGYGDFSSYGRQVAVWHNGNWLSLYSHMCDWFVFPDGTTVHQGDYIGTSGNTGGGAPGRAYLSRLGSIRGRNTTAGDINTQNNGPIVR